MQGTNFSLANGRAALHQDNALTARATGPLQSAWLNSLGFGGVSQLPTPPCSRGCGSTPNYARQAGRQPPVHPQRRLDKAAGAHRATARRTTVWPPGMTLPLRQASTTVQRRHRGPTSYADMPDYIMDKFQRLSRPWPQAAAGGRDRPGFLASFPGPRCRPWCPGTRSATARYLDLMPGAPDPVLRLEQRQQGAPGLPARRSRYTLQVLTPGGSPSLADRNLRSSCSATSSPLRLSPDPTPATSGLDHRPRPFRVQADFPTGRTGHARLLRAALANGRLRNQFRRLQHALVPWPRAQAGGWCR